MLAMDRNVMEPQGADGFAHALRNSRRVRLLRVLLPVVGLAAVGILAFWPLIRLAAVPLAIVSITPVDLTDAAITMETAKLAGFNRDNRPYEVTAARAQQSLQDPLSIRLAALGARIGLAGTGWVHLEASEGLYNTSDRLLDLARGVHVNSSAGDSAILDRARVELKNGRIVSDSPVVVRMGTATLAADRLELSESGRSVLFEGRVVMVLQPKAELAANAAKSTP